MATQVRRGQRGRATRTEPIVEAKASVPVLRPGIVERRALLDRLRGAKHASVVTIVAPAGYGKTTLLVQWVERDPRPAAWLSLDERDDDPSVLLSHLALAIDRVAPLDPAVLRAMVAPGPLGAAPRLSSAIRALERPLLLVMDDLHLVRGQGALDAISVLIEGLPAGSQMALAGRALGGLPLARQRAERRLLQIDAADLAMDRDEAALLFRQAGIDLPDEDVRLVQDRTEGWAAALYLAALAIRSGRPSAEIVPAGDDAFIADYIRSELLDGLSDKDRRFMRRTSVLERMSGSLCDAVTGGRGSAETLERLSIAITSVYRTMALWIPVMDVSRSSATVAIETFMTELSRAMRNWPAHNVRRTVPAAFATVAPFPSDAIARTLSETGARRAVRRPRAGCDPRRYALTRARISRLRTFPRGLRGSASTTTSLRGSL